MARLWDAETGDAVATLKGHEGIVWKAVFSSDSKRVVTASMDRTARVWIVETRELMERAEARLARREFTDEELNPYVELLDK